MNDLTIVFNAYYSEKSLLKVLANLKKFKIIVIENSLDEKIKYKIEKKYTNVKVVIPKENLGVAKGYNLAIKLSKTKYVFLNNPDIKISAKTITHLLFCAKKIKNFGAISAVYDDEKMHKNYGNYEKKLTQSKFLSKNKITEVKLIDNNFIVNKTKIKKNLFDEKYFLWFETYDFCLNLWRNNKKLFIVKSLKFKHYGSSSTENKYKKIVILSRAWHFNWSKFYYYRKNFTYIYALTKILPNLIKATKNLLINILKLNKFDAYVSFIEIFGIISSILCIRSFYRPKIKN
jgi:N-acetylglucosaminyl-diphospho-decaprenol L-rhamnosyltransferase